VVDSLIIAKKRRTPLANSHSCSFSVAYANVGSDNTTWKYSKTRYNWSQWSFD